MRTPKVVLDQIDKAVNPNRDLGKVKLDKPITLSYRDIEDVSDVDLVDVRWKKRYYSFDRGAYFPLDITTFTNYFGKMYRTEISGQYGNFVDILQEANSNVHYSVDVYTKKSKSISLYVGLSAGSVSLYKDSTVIFKSSKDNYYIPGKHTIPLSAGWNTLHIFIYHETASPKITITGDLGKKIDAWRPVDFLPPATPTWATTAIKTGYVDPTKGPALQNTLYWVNDRFNSGDTSLRGWGVYQYYSDLAQKTDGSNLVVVSGWGTYGFTVDDDYRNLFPAGLTLGLDPLSGSWTVSGTDYIAALGETIIYTYESNASISSGHKISRQIYDHLFDVEWDQTTPYIVSGIHTNVVQGRFYQYALDAYDDSVNTNRSEKTTLKSIRAGDFTPPSVIPVTEILTTRGGLKKITTVIKNPFIWSNKTLDAVGFRVWSEDDITGSYEDYLIGDYKINVSGTTTTLDITQTISAGSLVNLDDKTEYTFYLSCYDWMGNEILSGMRSVTATTSVNIKTAPGPVRVEMSDTTNAFRIFANTDDIA